MVLSSDFHSGVAGSNPVGATNKYNVMCNNCFSNKELAEKIETAREQTKKLLEELDSMKIEKSLKQCNINLDNFNQII